MWASTWPTPPGVSSCSVYTSGRTMRSREMISQLRQVRNVRCDCHNMSSTRRCQKFRHEAHMTKEKCENSQLSECYWQDVTPDQDSSIKTLSKSEQSSVAQLLLRRELLLSNQYYQEFIIIINLSRKWHHQAFSIGFKTLIWTW